MNPLLGVYLGVLGTVLYAFSEIFVQRIALRLDVVVTTGIVVVLLSIAIARSDFMLRFMPIDRARSYPSVRFFAEVGLACAVSFAVGLLLTWAMRV